LQCKPRKQYVLPMLSCNVWQQHPKKEAGVGSELTPELEIANVGKKVATLMRLESVVPDGLEITGQDLAYRVKDNYIDMK